LGTSLREESLKARTIQIKIRYSDFTTLVRSITLREPTSTARIIATTALDLLKTNKAPHLKLRLFGICARNFLVEGRDCDQQYDFFEAPERRLKEEKIEKLKDELKRRYGARILR